MVQIIPLELLFLYEAVVPDDRVDTVQADILDRVAGPTS
jgi:hypothetical protein